MNVLCPDCGRLCEQVRQSHFPEGYREAFRQGLTNQGHWVVAGLICGLIVGLVPAFIYVCFYGAWREKELGGVTMGSLALVFPGAVSGVAIILAFSVVLFLLLLRHAGKKDKAAWDYVANFDEATLESIITEECKRSQGSFPEDNPYLSRGVKRYRRHQKARNSATSDQPCLAGNTELGLSQTVGEVSDADWSSLTLCKKCKKGVPANLKSCLLCGARLESSNSTCCKKCGRTVSADQTLCDFCNADLRTNTTSLPVSKIVKHHWQEVTETYILKSLESLPLADESGCRDWIKGELIEWSKGTSCDIISLLRQANYFSIDFSSLEQMLLAKVPKPIKAGISCSCGNVVIDRYESSELRFLLSTKQVTRLLEEGGNYWGTKSLYVERVGDKQFCYKFEISS
ncbi:MAG: hypothetical protein JW936_06015 [Sedimentisphaerales bacterium]|nr:hypothetical protein [Sedimentisphaerales bacterium]